MTAPLYHRERADALSSLPEDWVTRLRALWDSHRTEDTLRVPGGEDLVVASVRGDAIRAVEPWLADLYQGAFLAWSTARHQTSLVAGMERNSLAVTLSRGTGLESRRHVDGVPVVTLLYAATAPEGGGGELILHGDHETQIYRPCAGDIVTFRGGSVPHQVAPVVGAWDRYAVAMNYLVEGE